MEIDRGSGPCQHGLDQAEPDLDFNPNLRLQVSPEPEIYHFRIWSSDTSDTVRPQDPESVYKLHKVATKILNKIL